MYIAQKGPKLGQNYTLAFRANLLPKILCTNKSNILTYSSGRPTSFTGRRKPRFAHCSGLSESVTRNRLINNNVRINASTYSNAMCGGPFTSQPAAAAAQKGIRRRTLEALYRKVQLQESPYIHLRWRMECYKNERAYEINKIGNIQRETLVESWHTKEDTVVYPNLIGTMLARKGRLDETEKQI